MEEDRDTVADLESAIEAWQSAGEDLIATATVAAGLDVDQLDELGSQLESTMQLQGIIATPDLGVAANDSERIVSAQVDAFLDLNENVIGSVAADSSTVEEAVSRSLATLSATLTAGQSLMTAASPPSEIFDLVGSSGAPQAVGHPDWEALKAMLLGKPLPGTPVPGELREELEKLETSGATELGALATDTLMQAALQGAVKGLVDLDRSGGLREAFDAVVAKVHWLRRQGMRLVRWALHKLRDLIPDRFRKAFDDKINDLRAATLERAKDLAGNLLGVALGREGTERAWQRAVEQGRNPETHLPEVAEIVGKHTHRIDQVGKVREAASTAASLVSAVVAAAGVALGPAGDIVIGALAVFVLAIVGYQVWDGFRDVEALVVVV